MSCPALDTPLWRLVHAYRARNALPSGALPPMTAVLQLLGKHTTYTYAVLRGDKPASEGLIAAMAKATGQPERVVRRAAELTRAVRR